MKLSLRNILVFAPDLVAARHFYGELLGLQFSHGDDSYLGFRGDNFELSIFACEEPSNPDKHSQRAGSAIAFAVPSLEKAMAELSEKGVQFLHTTPNEGPAGRYVAFVDPFGTVHELVEEVG